MLKLIMLMMIMMIIIIKIIIILIMIMMIMTSAVGLMLIRHLSLSIITTAIMISFGIIYRPLEDINNYISRNDD